MRRRGLLLGSAATLFSPLAAVAENKAAPVVGYLSSATSSTYPAALLNAFRASLSESGYVEGKNLSIEYRWAEDRYERLPTLAEELVRRRVDVIAATGGIVTVRAAKAATATIPIVFSMGDDPISVGIVASFSRPGGNITGVSFYVVELGAKLFDLATELAPGAAPIGVLANPNRPSYQAVRETIKKASHAKGRQLIILDAAAEGDFEAAFARLTSSHAGAFVVTSDPLFLDRRESLVALAARHAIPTIYAWRAYVSSGGLISYGISLPGVYRRVGNYVGEILSGRKPADLPVERPTRFELTINLKTAKALGLTVPQSLLAHADEVIE